MENASDYAGAKSSRKSIFGFVLVLVTLLSIDAGRTNEFLRMCNASMAKAEAFVAECKSKARPFSRNFYPGGHGVPVKEFHSAWFEAADQDAHFGFGCVLGPKQEVRFLGMYFAVNPASFRAANKASFAFIDFDGNVGLEPANILLAIHRLTPPGEKPGSRDKNCEIGQFDSATNQTATAAGNGFFRIERIEDTDPLKLVRCLDRKIEIRETGCNNSEIKSFLNDTKSPIIYSEPLTWITVEGRLFIEAKIFNKICLEGQRPAMERLNFIREVCK